MRTEEWSTTYKTDARLRPFTEWVRDPLVEIYKSNDEFKFIFSIQCTKLQIAV